MIMTMMIMTMMIMMIKMTMMISKIQDEGGIDGEYDVDHDDEDCFDNDDSALQTF